MSKIRWDLIPWHEVREVAEVITLGAEKHSDYGWRDKEIEDHFAAAMRHLIDWRTGGIIDEETGKSALAHCINRLLFVMHVEKNYTSRIDIEERIRPSFVDDIFEMAKKDVDTE